MKRIGCVCCRRSRHLSPLFTQSDRLQRSDSHNLFPLPPQNRVSLSAEVIICTKLWIIIDPSYPQGLLQLQTLFINLI